MLSNTTISTTLARPIPDQAPVREQAKMLRSYPMLLTGRSHEPLVDLAEYGVAGQSYYSRPSGVSKTGLPGVSPTVLVRKSIAECLRDINFALQNTPEVKQLFGKSVELYVDEGVRSSELQAQLHDELIPAALRLKHPELSKTEIMTWRDRLIAQAPKKSSDSPSPHMTGGAFDIKLRYVRAEQGFVSGAMVPVGPSGLRDMDAAAPDYYEHKSRLTTSEKGWRANRRAFYWIMRGALTGDSGLVCNPNEWWHWCYGDQMWAAITQAPYAFFGATTRQD